MKDEKEHTTRVSVAYIPSRRDDATITRRLPSGRIETRPSWFNYLYTHMLIEDVRNGVVPFTRISTGKEFGLRLEPEDNSANQLIAKAISQDRERWYHGILKDVVCDFIRHTAGTLLYYGEAYFEIVYLLDDANRANGFDLS